MERTSVDLGTAVHDMGPDDVGHAARIYREALGTGIFGALGDRFARSYVDTFRSSPFGVALVATDRGRPVGMLIGTSDNTRHYRWVVRSRGWRLLVLGLWALLLRPRQLVRFVRTRVTRYARAVVRRLRPRRPRAHDEDRGAPASPHVAVLTHMAVDASCRGRGLGTRLHDAFLDEVRRRGAVEAWLVTRADTEGAARFYERLGWRFLRIRTDPDGHRVCVYRAPLE